MHILLLILALICLSKQQGDRCGANLDRGNSRCSNPKKGIRWFFDKQLEDCFEYLYEGCEGGQNTFEDKSSCLHSCIPADKPKCGGNEPTTGSCSEEDKTCPAGSKCDVGPLGAGICCDTKKEEEWEKERNPACKEGKLSTIEEWYGEVTRFGRDCTHKFCPGGYKCIQQKRLAYCCSEH